MDVLVRPAFRLVYLCADIEKGFLQIRIRESERDCLRFHWVEVTNNNGIGIYRFARLMFELTQSPFILAGTLNAHFDNCGKEVQEVVEK